MQICTANDSAVRSRSKRIQKPGITDAVFVTPEPARHLPRNRSPFGSSNNFHSQVPVSSMGVEIPSVQKSSSARPCRSLRTSNAHSIAVSTVYHDFDELTAGIGTQMEDDVYRLIAMTGPNRTIDGHDISRWQYDMQSRCTPLGILERRRHTVPATHPTEMSDGTSFTL